MMQSVFGTVKETLMKNELAKNAGNAVLAKYGAMLFFCEDPERKRAIKLTYHIKNEGSMLLNNVEACQLFMSVKSVKKIEGEVAEVGVFNGGSAKIICEAKGDKLLHLFDTFEGLPNPDEIDAAEFHNRQYSASIESVKEYLREYEGVFFYKGLFPDTAAPAAHKKFSFVHLDVDLYKSTKSCLDFFYPRMNRGGVILSHDYLSAAGVTKAFDEFFEKKAEPVIPLAGKQCLVVTAGTPC